MTTLQKDELTKAEVLEKLQLIVQDLLGLEEASNLRAASKLQDDLGIDSLSLVDFVVALEDSFGIRFPSAFNVAEIVTLGDTADLIVDLLLQQGEKNA